MIEPVVTLLSLTLVIGTVVEAEANKKIKLCSVQFNYNLKCHYKDE